MRRITALVLGSLLAVGVLACASSGGQPGYYGGGNAPYGRNPGHGPAYPPYDPYPTPRDRVVVVDPAAERLERHQNHEDEALVREQKQERHELGDQQKQERKDLRAAGEWTKEEAQRQKEKQRNLKREQQGERKDLEEHQDEEWHRRHHGW